MSFSWTASERACIRECFRRSPQAGRIEKKRKTLASKQSKGGHAPLTDALRLRRKSVDQPHPNPRTAVFLLQTEQEAYLRESSVWDAQRL
jgi:hypothetical protein